MSTILEALKKSERERKLNNIPTLTDMPAPQESSRWPIYTLISLLLIALIAGTVFFTLWFQNTGQANDTSSETIVLNNQVVSEQAALKDAKDAINVNVVSYSDDARQRFAMINGKMYREGEFIQAGLKVDSIEPNSVILNNRGRKIVRHP